VTTLSKEDTAVRFEVIDQCPVPARLAPVLRRIKERSGATLNSCDRSPQAEPILRRLGKKSQRQLYEGFIKGLPGYNPANPPGRSTHERRNDGVAYAGPVGAKLPYWCVGMDWSNAAAVVQAAAAEGFTATVTYPNNPREGHHVNFRRRPKLRPLVRPLREGSKGRAVRKLTRQLSYVRSVVDGQPYLDGERRTFDAETTAALKRFQREHHQVVDGIYGPNSRRQLHTSIRRMRRQKEGR
jgi:putative peptidoglycan binding protein